MLDVRIALDAAGEAQPVAWVAADTLNSPHPTCISSLAYMSQIDQDRGREYVPLYAAPVAAQKADEVECGCGDIYPADSYGAGFIDALGHCPNCEAAAPFDDSQTADDARDAADPLQGAADWLVKSLDKPRPAEIAAHLLIGHNRAERLFDAAIAQQRKENGNEH